MSKEKKKRISFFTDKCQQNDDGTHPNAYANIWMFTQGELVGSFLTLTCHTVMGVSSSRSLAEQVVNQLW